MEDETIEGGIEDSREELRSLKESSDSFLTRRIVLWVIRWIIGFAIIGIVVYFKPGWSWLWWVGLGFAVITPISALLSKIFLDRKLRQVQSTLAELERSIDDADGR